MPMARVALAYLGEFGAETMRYARTPSFVLPALLVPPLFYGLFACLMTPTPDAQADLFRLADYASLASIAPGLFAFGISFATESRNGFLQLKHAWPVPKFAYSGAKLAVAMLISVLSVLLLMAVGLVSGYGRPAAPAAARLVLAAAFGTLPFGTLGMLIGSIAGESRATDLVTLPLIPLACFSGLLVPFPLLPPALRGIAVLSPGYNLLGLAIALLKPDMASAASHGAYILVFTVVLGAIAQWRMRARR